MFDCPRPTADGNIWHTSYDNYMYIMRNPRKHMNKTFLKIIILFFYSVHLTINIIFQTPLFPCTFEIIYWSRVGSPYVYKILNPLEDILLPLKWWKLRRYVYFYRVLYQLSYLEEINFFLSLWIIQQLDNTSGPSRDL